MLQAMRRRSGAAWLYATGGATITVARRAVREEKSPDRTHDERVQDGQNRFDWYARHLYRPHQHFTYDPASWSRPLMEKVKHQQSLSLLERLRNLQERAAEQAAHADGVPQADAHTGNTSDRVAAPTPSEGGDAQPSYFYDAGDGQDTAGAAAAPASPSLQELLDKIEWLHDRLHMPRYCGTHATSLRRQAQYTQALRSTLVALYHRVRDATVDVTVSRDAMLCGWFALVRHIADLVAGLVVSRQTASTAPVQTTATRRGDEDDADATEEALVLQVYHDLRATLRAGVASDIADASLEQLIELLYLATHPFSVRCGQLDGTTPDAAAADDTAMAALRSCMLDKLRGRLMESQEGEDAGVQQERLDPVHVYALCTTVARRVCADGDAATTRRMTTLCCRLLRHGASYLLDLLRASLALPERGNTLLRPRGGALHAGSAATGGAARPRAIAMDAAGRSTGIRQPQTQPGDVVYITQAATAVVRRVLDTQDGDAAVPRECARCLDCLLRLFSYAPNYDLDAVTMAEFCNVLLEHGVVAVWGREAAAPDRTRPAAPGHGSATERDRPHRALRFMLLLSRLSFHDAVAAEAERHSMTRLLLHLCALPAPQPSIALAAPAWVREWRRLRGQALRGLFDALTPSMLLAVDATANGATWQSWEEAMAFGHVRSAAPVELWRVSCEARLGLSDAAALVGGTRVATRRCSASLALALLILRARLAAAVVPRASLHVGVDGWTVTLLAHCMSQAGRGSVPCARLCAVSAAWDEAMVDLPEEVQGLIAPLIAEVKEYLNDTAAGQHRVRCFHATAS